MRNDIIALLVALILPQFAYSSCNYLNPEFNKNSGIEPLQDIEIGLDEKVVLGNQNIGYGLWMKYQPFGSNFDINDVFSSQTKDKSRNSFVYLLEEQQTKSRILTFYIEISSLTLQIIHHIDYSFQTQKSKISINFDPLNYDGKWILFYFYFNYQSQQTTIAFILENQILNPKIHLIDDVPSLPNIIRQVIGGKYFLEDDNISLILSQFQGKISQIFSEGDTNLFSENNNLNQFMQNCKMETLCRESTYKLSYYDEEYRGIRFLSETIPVIEFPIYIVQGWIRIKELRKQHHEMVILRITINKDYNDDFTIGDKELYLKYFQDQQSDDNGFEITTYSYVFPSRTVYQSQQKDIIRVTGIEYLNLLGNWHYIQYEIGTRGNEQQAQFQIYFPSQQKVLKFGWEHPIYHFSSIQLQFHFGGDKHTQNFMSGYLLNWILTTYCTAPLTTFSPKCHYSCQTCNGPFFDNCLTCPINSNRIFLTNKNTCPCKTQYVDIKDQSNCELAFSIYPQLTLLEKKQKCKIDGYQFCDFSFKICSQGYFLYNSTCLQCPGYSPITRNYFYCSNCFFKPEQFSFMLECTEDTIQLENSCHTIERSYSQIQSFIVFQNSQNELELKENSLKNDCNDGYFLDIDNYCIPCFQGCQLCKNIEYCLTCKKGYYLTKEFQCKECKDCKECQLQFNSLRCISCHIGQYLNSNGTCTSCGSYCANCNNNRKCYYCDDPKMYYLTIDGENCQYCQISNCIYCYQYYVKEGLIYSTLDINFVNDQNYYSSLNIGCALCENNYYFNQVSLKCELIVVMNEEYNENEQCTFGLITDNQGSNYCLISKNRYTSTQNTDCSDLYDCVQCIQNYSEGISFCIICDQGYYSSILTGECHLCDFSCFVCIQQNKIYKDYWKQDIKAYYKFVLNQDNSHPFEKYATLSSQYDFEIICTKCNVGYILYEHQCIYDCDYDCTNCQVINGIATCVQCIEDQVEIRKSQYIQQCKNYEDCYYKAILAYNTYCSKEDYQNQLNSKSGNQKVDFQKKNIYIDYLQSLYTLDSLFSQAIKYLDSSLVREIDFQFTLIQGTTPKCQIKDFQTFETFILSSKSQIAAVNLKFIGNSDTTILRIQQLNINSFTSVIFEILQLETQIMFDVISVEQVEFKNCIFLSINQFAIQPQIKYLNLINLEFRNLSSINSTIFDSVTKNCQIQLNQIKITQSKFQNSSLFYLYAKSQNAVSSLRIQGISIFQTQLDNSFIIKIKNQKDFEYGDIILDFVQLKDVRISNQSSIFQVLGANFFQTNNIIITDCQFFYQSYFYMSNIIQIKGININNIQLVDSNLFSNKIDNYTSDISLSEQENLFIIQSKIENIQYNRAQSIIQIVQISQAHKMNVKLEYFNLNNCTYTIKQIPNSLSYNKSNIYIECYYCTFNEFSILRGYGLPDITILNSRNIEINNFYLIQMNQYYFKTLHSSLDCVNNYAQNLMSYYLYIGFFQNITISNLYLNSSITFNYPFIIFRGFNEMDTTLSLNLILKDSTFDSNMLIITRSNVATSIIDIQSELISTLTFDNVTFSNNHLNSYFQDMTKQSASTLLISLQQGNIKILNSIFLQNIMTNSTDSIMYIKATQIQISNTNFKNNNIISFSRITKNLLLFNQIDQQTLKNIFPINSRSGNGILISSNIMLSNLIVVQSYSNQGGGFSLITQSTSIINIQNSQFSNTLTSLSSYSYSLGGCIYIDSQLSTLKLIINNTIFDKCFSRKEGGALYLIPSAKQNYISMTNLKVSNCFSIQNTFISFSLSNLEKVQLDVYLNQIDFFATEKGFEEYISLLEFPTITELDDIRNNNPIIMFKYGKINIVNCNFHNIHIQSLINIELANNIILENIRVINSTLLYSTLIKVNLKNSQNGQLILKNLTFLNITEHQSNINKSESPCLWENQKYLETLKCQYNTTSNINFNINESNISLQQIQKECNKNQFYENIKYNFSLIEIEDVNDNHHIKAESLIFNSVNCSKCQHGLISFLNIKQVEKDNIFIKNINMANCVCGQTGCLSILQYWNENILATEMIPNNLNKRLLQQHDYTKLAFQVSNQVKIIDSLFLNNNAIFGGSLFIVETQVLIHNCRFQNNSASIGGAIYFYSKNSTLLIFDSFIIENNAQIAGGIFLNEQSIQETKQLDVIMLNNNSTKFGQDIYESPRSLTISVDAGKTFLNKKIVFKNSSKIIEQIQIVPYKVLGSSQRVNFLTYPSGISISSYEYFDLENLNFIPYNLTFRIIPLNKFNHQMKKQTNSFCILSYNVFNLTDNSILINYPAQLSLTKVEFNQTSEDFNLDDIKIIFDPLVNEDIVLRLNINCNNIKIPQYNLEPPYNIQNLITDYELIVDLKTFNCQLGEYLNSTSGGCIFCDPSLQFYSVQVNAQSCNYKDDQKMRSIKSSMIELKSEYWRAYYYSDKIEHCFHNVNNCLGGWKPGYQSCFLGHIGALCEQCDLYNIRGDGFYSISSPYQCGNCNQILDNVLTICLISFWTLISTFLSVLGTIRNINDLILEIRLKSFKINPINSKVSSAILIKVFTNYFQILSTISTFQLQIPPEITSIINNVGNPIDSMAYSFDCFLITISDILIIYFRIIWSLITAASFLVIFFIFGGLVILMKFVKFKFSFISTAFLYIFIYVQPNLIGGLISLLSYRLISNELWIQGNVAYRYDNNNHFLWLLSFCLPLILLFGILLPTYFFYKLYINKNFLDQTQIRQNWGYLYNEYKQKAYFWEIIKILQKELIIIVLAYYEDHVPIKASLVFLCLFAYIYLTNSFQPYYTGYMNQLDKQSIIICAISAILGSQIYVAQQSNLIEIIWPFYIIIGIINLFFIIKIVVKIIFAYFNKLYDQIENIRELIFKYFPSLIKLANQNFGFLQSKKKQKARIKERFAKIKGYLIYKAKLIIQYKRTQKFDFPIQNRSDSSHFQNLYSSGLKLSPVKSSQNQQSYILDQFDDQKSSFFQLMSQMQGSLSRQTPIETSKVINSSKQ
ncbi:unnamed protein product [Paramecium sonneborni]|uniref:Transmembrane protein n=1 Tax=Paramecium sonneborni TaxID=65129 RepID=A0A8S1R5W9_9CILI|nr:unnamed protein product [Paramecium sonneborni]